MQQYKILIVDDEPDLLYSMKSRLEFEGFSVSTASEGEEAVTKATNDDPDLILLDVMMPKLNGFQVCRELRSKPGTKDTPIIIVSAKSQPSDAFWGLEVGASSYLVKPVDPDELIALVKQHVDA